MYVVEIGPNRFWKFDIHNKKGKEDFVRRILDTFLRKLDAFQVGNAVLQY